MKFRDFWNKIFQQKVKEQEKLNNSDQSDEDDDDPIKERELIYLINYNYKKVQKKAKELGLYSVPNDSYMYYMSCADDLKRTFNSLEEYQENLVELAESTVKMMIGETYYTSKQQKEPIKELELDKEQEEELELEY